MLYLAARKWLLQQRGAVVDRNIATVTQKGSGAHSLAPATRPAMPCRTLARI